MLQYECLKEELDNAFEVRGVSKRSFRIVETMCIEEVECSDVAIVQIRYLWYMLKGAKDLF